MCRTLFNEPNDGPQNVAKFSWNDKNIFKSKNSKGPYLRNVIDGQ